MATSNKDDVQNMAASFLNVNLSQTSPMMMQNSKIPLSKQLSQYITLMVHLLPIIVVIFILTSSIILQTVRGFVFLGFITASYVVRLTAYSIFSMFSKKKAVTNAENEDDQTYATKGYHCGISVYLLSFTFAYICVPMMFLKNINIMVLAVLLFCIFIDLFYKSTNLCDFTMETFFNIVGGFFIGFLVCFLMYMGGASKYLFFSEVSSKEYCSVPQKQKFKCNVFKNGELLKI
jgi:L-asparagine transporter-like permease